MNLDELYLLVRNSVFNKNYYSVDIGLKKVLQIIDYLGYEINIKEKRPFPVFEDIVNVKTLF